MLYFSILFLLGLIALKTKGNVQLYLSIALLLLMMLLCGLRSPYVGADTIRYVEFAEGYDTSDRFGSLFFAVRDFLYLHGFRASGILLSFAILTYLPLVFVIYKESKLPALAVLIYMTATCHFFLETFNIVRQEMALSYLLLSLFCYTQESKVYKFSSILFYLIAVSCHTIIIIALPFVLMLRVRVSRNFVIAAVILSIFIGYMGADLFISRFVNLLGEITIVDGSYYNRYADNTHNVNWGFLGTLSHWLPLSLLCVGSYSNKGNTVYYNFFLIGTIMTNLLISNKFCDRIASVFTIAVILYIPQIYNSIHGESRKIVIISIFIFCFTYIYGLLSLVLHPEAGNVIPYSFYFQ